MKNSFWFDKTTYPKFQEPKITASRIFWCQSFLLISLADVVLPKVNMLSLKLAVVVTNFTIYNSWPTKSYYRSIFILRAQFFLNMVFVRRVNEKLIQWENSSLNATARTREQCSWKQLYFSSKHFPVQSHHQ